MKVKSAADIPGAKPESRPSRDIEKLVTMIVESNKFTAQTARANTEALIACAKGMQSKAPVVSVMESERPRKWIFTIERDEDGFVKRIIAEATDGARASN